MDSPQTLDPFALLTATEAAAYARVSVAVVCNWRNRGHLPIATREDGTEIRDSRGKPLYRLVDVARADVRTASKASQMAAALARRTAA